MRKQDRTRFVTRLILIAGTAGLALLSSGHIQTVVITLLIVQLSALILSTVRRRHPEQDAGQRDPDEGAIGKIQDRMRAERIAALAEINKLKSMIMNLDIGVLSYDSHGVIDMINPEACRILGTHQPVRLTDISSLNASTQQALLVVEPGRPLPVEVHDLNRSYWFCCHEVRTEHRSLKIGSLRASSNPDQEDMEAWSKMTRILTHEIMNTMTPISSLVSTLVKRCEQTESLDSQSTTSILKTIERRSHGLMQHVHAYRRLALIPNPVIEKVRVRILLDRAQKLMLNNSHSHQIGQPYIEPSDMEIEVDANLVEQVIINLLLNAIEAIEQQPQATIRLVARHEGSSAVIEVRDTGPGVAPELREQIFLPFHSTKTKGTGIGLSYARQVMHMHGGSIEVRSTQGVETVFRLIFPRRKGQD